MCSNCGIPCILIEGQCKTCYLFWKNSGEYRPLTGPLKIGDKQVGALRQRRFPPKGMFINHEDLVDLANSPPQAENVILQGLEKTVIDMKSRIQRKKQEIEIMKREVNSEGVEKFKLDDAILNETNLSDEASSSTRISSKWSSDEYKFASEGIRRYGLNFPKIAEVMQTKNEGHIKWYYTTYKKRHNLDQLLEEYNQKNSNGTS